MNNVVFGSGIEEQVESWVFPDTVDCFGTSGDGIAKYRVNVSNLLKKRVVLVFVDDHRGILGLGSLGHTLYLIPYNI